MFKYEQNSGHFMSVIKIKSGRNRIEKRVVASATIILTIIFFEAFW